MKLISVSILFICLMAATFSNWFIIAAYNINQKFISTELCVNKNKPAMQCNGHCFLSKQLAKEEAPASPLNSRSNEKFEIQLFCLQQSPLNFKIANPIKVNCNKVINFSPQQFIQDCFHPPQA